jgi:hypothetical protein
MRHATDARAIVVERRHSAKMSPARFGPLSGEGNCRLAGSLALQYPDRAGNPFDLRQFRHGCIEIFAVSVLGTVEVHKHILVVVADDQLLAHLEARASQFFLGGRLVRGGIPFKNDIGLDLHGNLQRYAVAAEAAGSTSTTGSETTGSDETAGSIKGVLIAN